MPAPQLLDPPQQRGLIYRGMCGKFTLFLMAAALAVAARGQDGLATVKVYTNPPGVAFRVDGKFYQSPAMFIWPAGSRHTLEAESILADNTRLNFTSWTTNGDFAALGKGRIIEITADPALTFFR